MSDIFSKQSEFERLYRACMAFAKSYTYDDVAAESVAAEAMVIYWGKQNNLPKDVPSLPYLMGITRNLLLHHLRSQTTDSNHLEQMKSHCAEELQYRIHTLEDCEPHSLYSKEINTIIEETLNHLSENARKAFVLSRYHGLTHKEIAIKLGISQKTVEYHISKAISLLKANLKDYLPLITAIISI